MAKPATAQQLAELIQQQQAAETAALEEQTAEDADGGTAAGLTAALTAALTAWVLAFGTLTAAGAGVGLASYLAQVRRDVDQAQGGLARRAARTVEDALASAAAMGARHAVAFARQASGENLPVPDVAVSRDAVAAARTLSQAIAEQFRLADRLLHPRMVSSWRDVLTGLGAARRAVGMVRSAVAWCLHRAINEGATQAIADLRARALWVTEPDACVVCLAYAGRFADRDGRFPGGLSADPASRSASRAAIESPPAHVNCRCRLVPWLPGWGTGPGSLPDLLRDQAWRSIAAGRGRPSESRAARRRAARALLVQRGLSARVRRQAQATAAGRT